MRPCVADDHEQYLVRIRKCALTSTHSDHLYASIVGSKIRRFTCIKKQLWDILARTTLRYKDQPIFQQLPIQGGFQQPCSQEDSMWFSRARRDPARARETMMSLPKRIDELLAMIRDQRPATAIYQRILAIGAELTQAPGELAFLRIARPETGETRHLVTLSSEYPTGEVIATLEGIAGRAMRTGHPQLVPDVARDADYRNFSTNKRSVQVRSELAVPLLLGDTCSGVLNYESPQRDWFTEEDLYGLSLLAEIAALANALDIERERLNVSPVNVDKVRLYEVLDEALHLFAPAHTIMAELYAVIPGTKQLIALAIRPESSAVLLLRPREGQGIIGQALSLGQSVIGKVDRSAGAHLLSTKSVLTVPVRDSNGHIVGVLNLESSQENQFDASSPARLTAGDILVKAAATLTNVFPGAFSEDLDAKLTQRLLNNVEEQIYKMVSPSSIQEAYHQILEIATQLINKPDISGGILRLRDEGQPTDDSSKLSEQTWLTTIATIGHFNPKPSEWLLSEQSICRRAIQQRKPQVILDVAESLKNGQFADSVPFSSQGSELIVPLWDGNTHLGVIVLICPLTGAFTDRDIRYVERLAVAVVHAIRRLRDIEAAQRAQTQLRYVNQIQLELAQLFSDQVLSGAAVIEIRRKVLGWILEWATQQTEANTGVIVLAEIIEGHEGSQELLPEHVVGGRMEDMPDRWEVHRGITGWAYQTGEVQNVPDVSKNEHFEPAFPNIQSELAFPMVFGQRRLGVLDLESVHLHHFTKIHLHWARFLAGQAAFTLMATDLAMRRYRENALKELAREADQGIVEMRSLLIAGRRADIAKKRRDLRQKLLMQVVELTGATRGRILFAISVYDERARVRSDSGKLIEAARSPGESAPVSEAEVYEIDDWVREGIFRRQQKMVFNRPENRSDPFFSRGEYSEWAASSGVVLPIREGSSVTHLLILESDKVNWFTRERVNLAEEATFIASDIMISTRQYLDEDSRQKLRTFELEILGAQTSDVESYMKAVLTDVGILTGLQDDHEADGWAQIVLVRKYPGDASGKLRIEQSYSMTFQKGESRMEDKPYEPEFDRAHPTVTHPVYLDVLENQRSRLILETRHPSAEKYRPYPWPDAGALLCVPLLKPRDANDTGDLVVYGLLTAASSGPRMMSDTDDESLNLFAQTISIGLQNVLLF